MNQTRAIIEAARPRQWLKNFLLFVPMVFGGELLRFSTLTSVSSGFIAFCLLSSSNYILNDVIDVEKDRRHPYKRYRAVARRDIPERTALIVAISFLASGLLISNFLGVQFFLSACGFVLLHWFLYYFFRTKSVIDVLAIASGYVLRVFAGEALTGTHISVWLFLSVLSFSLLLAIGKRRVELSLVQSERKKKLQDSYPNQFQYSEKLLDAYVAVFANATFLTYAYFTFLTTSDADGFLFHGVDMAIVGRKWMMITIPPALYGIMRYLQLVYTEKVGSLERILTSDRSLTTAFVIWGFGILLVVYGIGR